MRFLGNKVENSDFEGLRTLVLPSGIGEFQWAMAKLLNTGEKFCILGLDGAPRRLHQFCELHPQVEAFGYTSAFDYTQIRMWMEHHDLRDWATISRKFGLGQLTALACNPHLEAGRPLAEWLPDLPTTYRYELNLTTDHFKSAGRYLGEREYGDTLIGISCASYRGSDAWKTWRHHEWGEFLRLVQGYRPDAKFVLLGGSWDDLTASVFDDVPGVRWLTDSRGIPPVGRTEFGAAVAVLSGLSGYIGFSSGLGHVAAHNVGLPVFMMWPDHEQALSRTWVDPELLESGKYVPSPWEEPAKVFERARPWLSSL